MKASIFERKLKGNFFKKNFDNEVGEKFTIYVTDTSAYLVGSETDGEIVPIFNPYFCTYSRDEMQEIGKALIEAGIK